CLSALAYRYSPRLPLFFIFFFHSSGPHRDLHSFPTRRSSDLQRVERAVLVRHQPVGERARRRLVEALGLIDQDHLLLFFLGHPLDRKSTRLNSSHVKISYAVFCLKKKKKKTITHEVNKQTSQS